MTTRYDDALKAAVTSKKLPVFDDLVDLADSGEIAGRVRTGQFNMSTEVWYVVEVDGDEFWASVKGGYAYAVTRLRNDYKMRGAIKRTAAQRRLPEIKGPVTVSFKHEGTQGSQAVGPVVIVDHQVFDKDPEVIKSQGHLGVPFGYKPQGQHELGWQTYATARRVARHYGVSLEEF